MNDDRIKYFTGKVVLITGGASGLGAALAGEISSCHARVLVLDNNQDGLEKLTHNNSLIRAYHADVSDLKMIQQTLGGINREFGQIDILVNNAGVVVTGEARDFSVEQWRKCFEVNLLGTVNLLSYIYPDPT